MSIESNIGQETINSIDNRKKFCEVFNGKNRYWGEEKYWKKDEAVETRKFLILLKPLGEDYESLSKKLNLSISTLSRAAGGTAGIKPDIKHDNKSTTCYIVENLRIIYNQYQGPDSL